MCDLTKRKGWKASPGEVLQKVEKEAEMISEGHLEAVAAAWQEEAETRDLRETESECDWLLTAAASQERSEWGIVF